MHVFDIGMQVLDALQHVPYSIEYMQRLQNTQVFRFCAIPQIMAIGTLALCYDNGKVFEGNQREAVKFEGTPEM